MPGESFLRRKWWHGTLSIKDKNTEVELAKISSIEPTSAAVNARYDAVFAYTNSNYAVDCQTAADVPVASFDITLADGYFVFRPNVDDLDSIFTEVYNYQDAINLANRRIFSFTRTAAYDPLDAGCNSTVPTRHDTYDYEEVTNNSATILHRYRVLNYYTQTTCCAAEITIPSSDIPSLTSNSLKTKIYYLVLDETNNLYKIYSYNFALLSGALNYHGAIASSSLPSGIQIQDITWFGTSMFCISNKGIYRLYLGNSSSDATLGEEMTINYNNYLTDLQIQYVFTTGQQTLEYNKYDSCFYAIIGTKKYVGDVLTDSLLMVKLDKNDINSLRVLEAREVTGGTSISFAVPKNYNPTTNNIFYTFSSDNLATISSGGSINALDNTNAFAGLSTFAFIDNTDENISEQLLIASNTVGQLFRVDLTNKALVNLSLALGYSPTGAATTINGENSRVNPFPFLFGNSPWLFIIDISASMIGENKIIKVKNALTDLLQNYVRYGEKISIVLYNNATYKITKVLRTYNDVYEVLTFIDTYMRPRGSVSNFCTACGNAANEFTDLKSCVIISDGSISDCANIEQASQTQQRLRDANNNLPILYADLSGTSENLRALAQLHGYYWNWR